MPDSFNAETQRPLFSGGAPILPQAGVERCHITLPDLPRPTGAVLYEGKFYAFVKIFPTLDAAQRGADRLMDRGNAVLLTKVPKGLVLWVHEPEAQLASKP